LDAPEAVALPMGYSEKLTVFQRLAILRCFRPDRVTVGAQQFIMEKMSDR
jgi:hypothetical protein